MSGIFLDDIDENDGRYREIFEAISEYQNAGGNKEISILDAGAEGNVESAQTKRQDYNN